MAYENESWDRHKKAFHASGPTLVSEPDANDRAKARRMAQHKAIKGKARPLYEAAGPSRKEVAEAKAYWAKKHKK